jgi:hypothetical protein
MSRNRSKNRKPDGRNKPHRRGAEDWLLGAADGHRDGWSESCGKRSYDRRGLLNAKSLRPTRMLQGRVDQPQLPVNPRQIVGADSPGRPQPLSSNLPGTGRKTPAVSGILRRLDAFAPASALPREPAPFSLRGPDPGPIEHSRPDQHFVRRDPFQLAGCFGRLAFEHQEQSRDRVWRMAHPAGDRVLSGTQPPITARAGQTCPTNNLDQSVGEAV